MGTDGWILTKTAMGPSSFALLTWKLLRELPCWENSCDLTITYFPLYHFSLVHFPWIKGNQLQIMIYPNTAAVANWKKKQRKNSVKVFSYTVQPAGQHSLKHASSARQSICSWPEHWKQHRPKQVPCILTGEHWYWRAEQLLVAMCLTGTGEVKGHSSESK